MQHLPMPATAAEDDAVIQTLARKPAWAPHEAAWLETYTLYRQHAGSPFALTARDFGPGIWGLQYKLYDTRKRGGPLLRMRVKKGLLSCPVCGSPVTGQLDHYLPRTSFPEYAIMRANLVPACSHCNSGVKGDTVPKNAPGRFIHPYFDDWAAEDLWRVDIVRPFQAATFQPVPVPQLVGDRAEIVRYHLKNVLGSQFHNSLANFWSTYPETVAFRTPSPDIDDVTTTIEKDLGVAIRAKGNNSWDAAFFRGLSADPEAIAFVRDKSNEAAAA